MTLEETIEYIHSIAKFGSKLGLTNITKLLDLLGNPQNNYPIIHIAGTNGKGSTTSMIVSVLEEAGYKTGMFTSPYLENFTERVKVSQEEIDEDNLIELTQKVKDAIKIMLDEGFNHPTEFEVITAIGFLYFDIMNVDFGVIEVGLGGRFDSTNIVKPALSVITSIGYDHIRILGNTIDKIAFEKAGIIKENAPVITIEQSEEAVNVIKAQAKAKNSKFSLIKKKYVKLIEKNLDYQLIDFKNDDGIEINNIEIPLLGPHQLLNANLAINAILQLNHMGYSFSNKIIKNGIKNAKWPGRLEKITEKPLIFIDGAHNPHASVSLCKMIKENLTNRKIILIGGCMKDKNYKGIFDGLVELADEAVFTKIDYDRMLDPKVLHEAYKDTIPSIETNDLKEAIDIVLQEAEDDNAIIICGSLYIAGSARTYLKNKLKGD